MNYLNYLNSYKEAFLEDLKGLINIPSIKDEHSVSESAPFGLGCREALDYMLKLAKREGFKAIDYDGYAMSITYGEGEESVGVLAHLDVVPVGEGWSKDPFAGTIENGVLYGRGSLDDKGAAMAIFYALKMLKEQDIVLHKKIILIYGCDEESGCSCMEYYRQHGGIPALGFTPDADFPVIYGEKGGLNITLSGTVDSVIEEMHAGERANIVIGKAQALLNHWEKKYEDLFLFYLKCNDLTGKVIQQEKGTLVSIEGSFAHGAMPYKGVNAGIHLLNFVGSALHDEFALKSARVLSDWTGKGLGIAFEGADMGFLTINTGIINIENKHVNMVVDVRYPNDSEVETIQKEVLETLQQISYPLAMDMKVIAKPLFVDPNSMLVQTLDKAYRHYSEDFKSSNVTIGGGTYAKKFDHFVAFGPEFPHRKEDKTELGGPHECDEGIRCEDLFLATAIYCEAMEKLAQGENSYENA